MRARPALASPLYPKLRFAFTDHPITVWAGVILLRLYVELLDLRTALTNVLTPVAKTSNHQIPVVDVLLAWWYGLALGAERLATGHYVRLAERVGRLVLRRGLDPTKDQSYVLSRLTQEQLAGALFPLGELRKEDVRRMQAIYDAEKMRQARSTAPEV